MRGRAAFGIEPLATREIGCVYIGIGIVLSPCSKPHGCSTPGGNEKPGVHGEPPHSLMLRKRNELPMTDTEERLMAAAAIIGDSRTPKNGNKMPAATGTPAEL